MSEPFIFDYGPIYVWNEHQVGFLEKLGKGGKSRYPLRYSYSTQQEVDLDGLPRIR